jgi:hypothetical protein
MEGSMCGCSERAQLSIKESHESALASRKFMEEELDSLCPATRQGWNRLQKSVTELVREMLGQGWSYQRANTVAWSRFRRCWFEYGSEEDEEEHSECPLLPRCIQWAEGWSDAEEPLLVRLLMIGFKIAAGVELGDASDEHNEWLSMHMEHRVWGGYFLANDGIIRVISERREHLVGLSPNS